MMEIALIYLASLLMIFGAAFALIASIGIVRLPDIYSRMHSASKAGTVGSGLMLIALALLADDLSTTTRALAGVVFFILTAPLAAHLLAKAAYEVGYKLSDTSVMDEMKSDGTE